MKKALYNDSTIIRAILREKQMLQKDLARAIGRSLNTVNQSLTHKSGAMNVDTLCEMLDVLGYELVIQQKKPGKRTQGQYLIEPIETEGEEK